MFRILITKQNQECNEVMSLDTYSGWTSGILFFCDSLFLCLIYPVDEAGGIMFSGCPSICASVRGAYVRASGQRHLPFGLLSTSS